MQLASGSIVVPAAPTAAGPPPASRVPRECQRPPQAACGTPSSRPWSTEGGTRKLGLGALLPIPALIPCVLSDRRQRAPRLAVGRAAHRAWRRPGKGRVACGDGAPSADLEECVEGTLTYQGDEVERSLKHQGVGSKDGDLIESEYLPKTVPIKNGRGRSWDLSTHGFTVVEDEPEIIDFYNEMAICKKYYPACCELVKRVTGAAKVFAFYHTVRSHDSIPAARKRMERGFPVEAPAASVHVDYSEACAARQLRILSTPPTQWPDPRPLLGFQRLITPEVADEYLRGGKRWCIFNVWRNLSAAPVQRTPVALCDGTTVSLDDIVTFQSAAGRHTKEYYFTGYSEKHRWYYFPRMRREEAILIKNWDSAGDQFAKKACEERVPSTFAFHTAFNDPNTQQGAPRRECMEVRTVALFD